MDDPAQVQAFLDAGSDRGALAPIYLFNTALATALIRPGDRVVDLACGPANQLAQLAAVNPDARFVGVDLSSEMLRKATDVAARQQLSNVEFETADIARLDRFADRSVDVVISTLSLHHLPDQQTLAAVFDEINRVLKPDGRVYISDLGCLRSERAIAEFARQYADQQPEIFTLDYLNSMRAAFTVADFRAAIRPVAHRVRLHSTLLVPYMLVVKSRPVAPMDATKRRRIEQIEKAMPTHQQTDLKMLRLFFRLSGLTA
jgi:SAM-dependent methyltransferase